MQPWLFPASQLLLCAGTQLLQVRQLPLVHLLGLLRVDLLHVQRRPQVIIQPLPLDLLQLLTLQ